MRVVLAALSALLLTACNMVVSREPLFSMEGAAQTAQFRDGWWVNPKAGCAFDEAGDARDWPECAKGQWLRAGQMIDLEDPSDPANFVLAGGDPHIMQVEVNQKGLRLFAYAAVQPLKRDPEGRIIEARTWLVLCGPPPPEPKDAKGPMDFATRAPLPGLTVDKETGNCWTDKAQAVRAAAGPSQAWDKDKAVIRWVRDVRPEEQKPKPAPQAPAEP
jgi:hypothetical protein